MSKDLKELQKQRFIEQCHKYGFFYKDDDIEPRKGYTLTLPEGSSVDSKMWDLYDWDDFGNEPPPVPDTIEVGDIVYYGMHKAKVLRIDERENEYNAENTEIKFLDEKLVPNRMWARYGFLKLYKKGDRIKCDCGAEKAYGKNCSKSFHYDWCKKVDYL